MSFFFLVLNIQECILCTFFFMQASRLITEICQNLSTAAKSVGNNDYTVVLRGDSTLRGHFPEVTVNIFVAELVIM